MSFSVRIGNHVHRRAILATMCIVMVVILSTITMLFNATKTVHANVEGFGAEIYWDQGCTNRTRSIDWGPIEPDSNSTVIIYVRNEGDSAVSLWMATSHWTPSVASGYITLTWTYSGRTLSADEVIPIELNLNVSPTISGITDFSFDIAIATTG